MFNKTISRLTNSEYRVPILCGIFAVAPIALSMLFAVLGISLGCGNINEAGTVPCVRFGIHLEGILVGLTMGVGFLSIATFPIALIVIIAWLLWKKLSRAKLAMLGVFAVVAVAGIIKFSPQKESAFINGYYAKEADLAGTWLRSPDGMPGTAEGFILKSGGEAKSVNIPALACSNWRLNPDAGKLELDCVRAEAQESSAVVVEYEVAGVSSKRLLLKDPSGMILSYSRGK